MIVTIIPQDKIIIVDGKGLDLPQDAYWEFDDEHIHAIHWKSGKGEIEYENIDGQEPLQNKLFTDESIISPYLEYYRTFLNHNEEQELQRLIDEEEKISSEFDNFEREQTNLLSKSDLIQDLEIQNKELRLLRQEDNIEKEKIINQKEALELEKLKKDLLEQSQNIEKREISSHNLSEELNERMSSQIKNFEDTYTSLLDEFEQKKNQLIEEHNLNLENIQKERELLEEKEIFLENEKIYNQQYFSQKEEDLDEKESILRSQNDEKYYSNLLDQELLKFDKDDFERLREAEIEKTDISIQRMKDLAENEIREQKEISDRFIKIREEKFEEEIKEREEQLLETQENFLLSREDREIDEISIPLEEDSAMSLLESVFEHAHDIYDDVYPKKENINSKDHTVDDVLSLMEELDPEKLYTALTSEEKEENNFPIDKAVQWFSALKDVIDKNS